MPSQEPEYLLNHSEFIVLGLISEESSHAYKLDEKIEKRGMRNWTSIGTSSIYRVIKNLEEAGLTERWIEEVDNRVIKVYQITPKGSEILKNHIYNVLKEYYGKYDEDFYVAFSMLPILNKKEQITAISHSIEKIKNHIKELKDMLEQNSEMPLNITGLFIHPIEVLKTDYKFLEWVLEQIKNKKGKAIPDDYLIKRRKVNE
ncbi:MAG: PadR family transcriptional regulator [Promethearchaeota archaeon]|nr:MAG: PadR family transcriptional regulator [Candidatus Lokiarchaeota archaeon]